MYTAVAYRKGHTEQVADRDTLSDLIANPLELVWVDLLAPGDEELDLLEREFGFHRLALDDVKHGHQRPKIDQYDNYCFLVLCTIGCGSDSAVGFHLEVDELFIFVGKNYLVTIHAGPVQELEDARRRWDSHPEYGKGSSSFLLYTLCDSIVDSYFPALDRIEEAVDEMEEKIFVAQDWKASGTIFDLRKELLKIRKVLGPERDVFNALTQHDLVVLNPKTRLYFADVYDHVLRALDLLETYRDLLSSALEGYLSTTSNNLNEIMKVLTASSIILMSATLVSSVYGMNFKVMPELDWTFGYAWALGFMALVAFVLFILFRRRRWL